MTSAGPTRFSCRLFADATNLRPARQAIVRWAAEAGVGPEIVEDVALAVGEALSNSIEHAYRVTAGHIELDGRWTARELCVVVVDHGQWLAPTSRAGWRGRGISMIHTLADEARVEQRESGTTVTMIWHLRP